jgi:hypothetical protein
MLGKILQAIGGLAVGLLVGLGVVNAVDRVSVSLVAQPLFTRAINTDNAGEQ